LDFCLDERLDFDITVHVSGGHGWPPPSQEKDTTMLLLADMLFRRANARRSNPDSPIARPRAKTGRSPRARLHGEAWTLLP
jgi:hypothetical protein